MVADTEYALRARARVHPRVADIGLPGAVVGKRAFFGLALGLELLLSAGVGEERVVALVVDLLAAAHGAPWGPLGPLLTPFAGALGFVG